MHMLKSKYILSVVFLLATTTVSAQKAERDYIRKGNRLFNDSVFVDAEVNYRKALEINPKSTVSMYNLGNTLSQQQKFQDAMEQYVSASNIEKDKMKLAHIYHNMGVLFQAGKDYAKAVDAYKMSLRNNPTDHETRYNLALAQKMLKDQQQNQQNQDQNQDQNKDQQKQDQKQDQNKDKQNDQKQDEKKDQQQPPKSEKQNNQMSKENAEQLLNSVMQDEKNVQDKVKKQRKVMQGGRLEKDW
ncbi:tetratricopeptide repeat protein [Bacteroides sp. f07]